MAYPTSPGVAVPQKPSKTGIIWAIAIFVVTAIIGIVMIVLGVATLTNAVDDFEAIDAGASRTIQLDSGDYYVFAGSDTGDRLDVARMSIEITDPDGGTVRPSGGSDFTSDTGDGYFESIGEFEVSNSGTHPPGEYTVTVDGPAGATARVGEMPFLRIGLLIGGGIAIGFIGFVVALIILIVALVRRSRLKKANRDATMGYGGPGGPPAPYATGGYGTPPGPQPYGQAEPPYPQQGPPAPMPPPASAPTPPPPAPTPPPPAPTGDSPSWPPPSPPSGPTSPPPAPPG